MGNKLHALARRNHSVQEETPAPVVPSATGWDELPLVLNSEEVAQILRVGVRVVYDLARVKGFPVVRHGRAIRIPRDALRHWLDRTGYRPA